MGDLIDRQAAIETVRKPKDKSEAHRMLAQLPSAQQWIPVTEWLLDDYIKAYPDVHVIAWKPLEEPYCPEGEERERID